MPEVPALADCGLMNMRFVAVMLLAFTLSAQAEEKNGIRVDVTKKTVERNDGPPSHAREIGRTMTLGVTIKNVSFADQPAGEVGWIVLVRRWTMSEVERLEIFEGTEKLPALVRAQAIDMQLGEIKIGGHLHGTSKEHVDEIAGWKVAVKREGKATEFTSGSRFDSLHRRAARK